MESVTVRDLRNRGGEVLDRVERGERVIVTRDGRAVARSVAESGARTPPMRPTGVRSGSQMRTSVRAGMYSTVTTPLDI